MLIFFVSGHRIFYLDVIHNNFELLAPVGFPVPQPFLENSVLTVFECWNQLFSQHFGEIHGLGNTLYGILCVVSCDVYILVTMYVNIVPSYIIIVTFYPFQTQSPLYVFCSFQINQRTC